MKKGDKERTNSYTNAFLLPIKLQVPTRQDLPSNAFRTIKCRLDIINPRLIGIRAYEHGVKVCTMFQSRLPEPRNDIVNLNPTACERVSRTRFPWIGRRRPWRTPSVWKE
jgi:hypothetical protein